MPATPDELPKVSHSVVQTLFVLMQFMYMGFYVGALANLAEISDLFSPLPRATHAMTVLIVTAAILIPVRAFVITAVLFHAPEHAKSTSTSGRFCSSSMCYGRSRPSCCCTTSTLDWRWRLPRFSSIRLSHSARWS